MELFQLGTYIERLRLSRYPYTRMLYFVKLFGKSLCIWVVVVWLWNYCFRFPDLAACPSLFCDDPYVATAAGIGILILFWTPIASYFVRWCDTPRNKFTSPIILDVILSFFAIDLLAWHVQVHANSFWIRSLSSHIFLRRVIIALSLLSCVIPILSITRWIKKKLAKMRPHTDVQTQPKYRLILDEPIKHRTQDILGFAPAADVFATIIVDNISVSRESSFAIGITGRWGTGKTSFFNLLEDALRKQDVNIEVVRFCSPLPISKVEVIEQFFNRVEGAIKRKYLVPGLSAALLRYKHLFSSLDSSFFKGIAAYAPRDELSIRESLRNVLQSIEGTFVVLLDDFDRFSEDGEEQRVLLWLLRMFSDMPQFIFVLVYDPQKVSRNSGERYIDKFIQLELPVPFLSNGQQGELAKEVLKIVERNRSGDKKILEEEVKRLNEFVYYTRHRIETLRDSKKFCNALIPVLAAVGDLSPSDVVAFHYLRLYYPEVFDGLMRERERFLDRSQLPSQSPLRAERDLIAFFSNNDSEEEADNPRDSLLEELLKQSSSPEKDSLIRIINLIFPKNGGASVDSKLTGRLSISTNLDRYLLLARFISEKNIPYIEEFLSKFLFSPIEDDDKAYALRSFLEDFPEVTYPLNLILSSKHKEIEALLDGRRELFGKNLARSTNILVAQVLKNESFIEAQIARAVSDVSRLHFLDRDSERINYLTKRAEDGASSPLFLAFLLRDLCINANFPSLQQQVPEQLTEFFNGHVKHFEAFEDCGIPLYQDARAKGTILSEFALTVNLSGLNEDDKKKYRGKIRETLAGLLKSKPQEFADLLEAGGSDLLSLFRREKADSETINVPRRFSYIYESSNQVEELIQQIRETRIDEIRKVVKDFVRLIGTEWGLTA